MKVLIIICTDFVPYGGLTTVVMNYYRAINKEDISIDIASTNMAPKELYDELMQNNSSYINLGKRIKICSYIKHLSKVLKNKYDVIHVNGNSATMLLELLPAKIAKVPIRIAHVHTTQTQHPFINILAKLMFKKTYNKAVAVSRDAGDWLFGENYTVLNNAINVDAYRYSATRRKKIRNNLNISDTTFVVGNVGKLNHSKNHNYLLNVFVHVRKMIPDSKMIIVGGGELENDLIQMSEELGIKNDIVFTGMLDDTSDYFQAFDFFAFPSKFEGLGLALIEAQSSGLRCIISDKVPNEAIVTDQVMTMSIDGNHEKWAEYIVNNRQYNREENSYNAGKSIRECGYDIEVEAEKLRDLYMNNHYKEGKN